MLTVTASVLRPVVTAAWTIAVTTAAANGDSGCAMAMSTVVTVEASGADDEDGDGNTVIHITARMAPNVTVATMSTAGVEHVEEKNRGAQLFYYTASSCKTTGYSDFIS